MKRYMIKFVAAVGRKKTSVADDEPGTSMHAPVELTYFAVQTAKNEEELNSKIVLYGDPGFKTRVESISELADNITGKELEKLMPLSKAVDEID